MKITSATIYMSHDETTEHLLATANIELDDQLIVRGLRIMKGDNGMFVAFPIEKPADGSGFRSIVYPNNRKLSEHIENTLLEKFVAISAQYHATCTNPAFPCATLKFTVPESGCLCVGDAQTKAYDILATMVSQPGEWTIQVEQEK